jgi:hypothetical protein
MQKVARNYPTSNSPAVSDPEMSSTDRRLLLRATLLLFLRRLNRNIPVLRDDLLRLAYYAPEEAPRA